MLPRCSRSDVSRSEPVGLEGLPEGQRRHLTGWRQQRGARRVSPLGPANAERPGGPGGHVRAATLTTQHTVRRGEAMRCQAARNISLFTLLSTHSGRYSSPPPHPHPPRDTGKHARGPTAGCLAGEPSIPAPAPAPAPPPPSSRRLTATQLVARNSGHCMIAASSHGREAALKDAARGYMGTSV